MLDRTNIVFGAALIASACLVACGGSTPPPEEPKVEAAPEPEPEPAAEEPKAEEPAGPPPPLVIKDVGFDTPESVLHDVENDVYLVSNIGGDPLAKDDNGFISKLSPDGEVTELKWIDGASPDVKLDAPKGLGIADGKLYVTDIDVVRVFDLATGKPAGNIKVKGATFLNDVAVAPDGTVYVSDTGLTTGFAPSKKDAVYTLTKKNTAKALIKGVDLKLPNGLFADDKGVVVVTWSGELYRVTPEGKKEEVAQAPGAQLDGVVQTSDGRLLVSSWETSTVYSRGADGTLSPLFADIKAPADIGYDAKRSQVLVPLFQDNAVQIHVLPAAPAASAPEPSDATASGESAKAE